MFKPTKLALAMSLAVGTSAVGLGTAQAGVAFFPFAVVSDTVTTIFSVVNTAGDPVAAPEYLHYRYYYKPMPAVAPGATDEEIEDAWNEAHCEEVNRNLPTSENDIQTIDIAGTVPGAVEGVLFNDPSIKNDWLGKSPPFGYALGQPISKPHRGYLVVEHLPSDNVTGFDLYGEAVVFEFGSGASWGYQAFENEGNSVDFSRFASASPSHVSIFPFDQSFVTKFMVTPLYDRLGVADVLPNNSNWNTADVTLDTTGFGQFDYAMYDRDEVGVSGAQPKRVICTGAVTAEYLLSEGAVAQVPDGGWAGVTNISKVYLGNPAEAILVDGTEPGAVVFKLEYGPADGVNPPAPGVFNNAIYLHPLN